MLFLYKSSPHRSLVLVPSCCSFLFLLSELAKLIMANIFLLSLISFIMDVGSTLPSSYDFFSTITDLMVLPTTSLNRMACYSVVSIHHLDSLTGAVCVASVLLRKIYSSYDFWSYTLLSK